MIDSIMLKMTIEVGVVVFLVCEFLLHMKDTFYNNPPHWHLCMLKYILHHP